MKKHLALLLSFGFFVINIFLLPDYGLTWDEPEHYLRGQAYLRFFLTGKKDYQGLPRLRIHRPKNFYTRVTKDNYDLEDDRFFRRSLFQDDNLNFHFFIKNDGGHPPLSDILASFFNFIFYQKLGLVTDIESYHLFIVLVSSLLVFVVALLTQELYGSFAALVASLALVLYPLFLAESHFNIKDPVEATFYALTIYAFFKGITRSSWRWIITSAFFCGLALGTKLNIVFLPFILLPWLLVRKDKLFLKDKKSLLSLLIFPVIAFAIFYCSWPLLWGHPERIITHVFDRYKNIGYGITYQPEEYLTIGGVNTYPWQWIFYTTPLVTLFLAGVGIITAIVSFRKEENASSFLILFWFLVPITRVSLPKMGIYGGIRQIMEYMPAMAILSAIGAESMVKWLNGQMVKWSKKKSFSHLTIQPLIFLQAITLLMFLPILIKMIQIHPNQNAYFNPLIGGLKGAKERNIPGWGVTLGSVYQQGMDWLNKNAQEEANVALAQGLLSNIPRIKIRKDINFGERYWSGEEKKGEYLMEVVDSGWEEIPDEKREYLETLTAVFEVKVDDVAILKIWKNELLQE